MPFIPKSTNEVSPLAADVRTSSPYQLFWAHLRKRWFIFVVGVVAMIFTNVTEVLIPKCIQWTLDTLQGLSIPKYLTRASPSETLDFIFVVFIVFLLIQAFSRRYWRLSLFRETQLVGVGLRAAIWDTACYFPRERLDTDLNRGALMNAATSDVGNARSNFGSSFIGITDVIFLTLFSVIAMALIDPWLTLASLLILPLMPFALHRLGKREYSQHEIAQDGLSALNDLASQSVATVRLQRLTQTSSFWKARLSASANEYRLKRFKVVNTSLFFLIVMGLAPIFSYAVLFFLGLDKAMSGQLSVGEFVALQTYILLLQGPFSEMGSIVADWQRGKASLKRLSDIYRTPAAPGLGSQEEFDRSDFGVTGAPVFEAKNLRFSYPKTERVLWSDLDFSIENGARLGVQGEIGAGKSTLIDILSGLEPRFEGELKFLGRDIRAWPHHELTKRIGIVPQKPFLFAETIRNNVALAHPISDEEIWHYLEITGLADEVRGFKHGLDSLLGEWGINLSGGQRQRLTIARALAAKPSILLLDDCLSAVDTVTEEKILRALDSELKNTTLVWTAHRESTLRFCTHHLELVGVKH